jgi:ABC-type transport system substrate-binding protein
LLTDDSWTYAYDGLDPAYGFFVVDGYFANVFQGLVQFNGTDTIHVVPSLAQSWTVSPNFLNYTFTMRPNTWFSNKDPVNAYVAWFSFVRGLYINAPTTAYTSNYFSILFNNTSPCAGECVTQEGNSMAIVNIMPWGLRAAISNTYGIPITDENKLVAALNNVLSHFNPSNSSQVALMSYPHQAIVASSNSTLKFNLIQPYNLFLLDLPPQWGAIVDPVWIDNPANCGGVQNNTLCDNFITKGGPGTGPYMFGPIGPSESFVVLNANPNYWAVGLTQSQLCSQPGETKCSPVLQPPHIKTVIMNFGVEETTVIGDFGTNKVQLAVVGVPHFSQLLSEYSYSSHFGYSALFHNLGYPLCDLATGINGQVYPTNYTLIRQAIVHAVNYSSIMSELYTFQGTPLAELFQPPVPPGWGSLDNPNNIPLYSYNVTLASQYLNESGWQHHFYTITPAGVTLGNPSGSRLPALTFQYIVPLTSEVETMNEIVSSGLAQIGLSVNFQGITTSLYDEEVASGFPSMPNMVGVGWCADWPDPFFQQFVPMVDPYVAVELSGSVTNSTLLSLTLKVPFETNVAQQVKDAATAWAMYAQLAGILQDPNPATYVFAQPYVQNILYSPFQFAYLYNMMTYTTAS